MAAELSTSIATALIAGVAALAGAMVGAIASLRTNTRNIRIENITKERAKWRDKVREIALAVHKDAVRRDRTALDERHLEFSLILNPTDREDRAILNLIHRLKSEADEIPLIELGDRIALLLKHDWERAKWEAKGESTFLQEIDAEPEPKRTTYAQFTRTENVTLN